MSILIVTAVAACMLIGCLTAVGPTPASRRRETDRRLHRVSRHPSLVNLGDVQRRVDADLAGEDADFVIDRIALHRIDAGTVWIWLDRFGPDALVLALAAGYGYAGLLRILRDEELYNEDELRVLAALNEPTLFYGRPTS